MKCIVKISWDEEARIWYSRADDVLRLVLESGSFDALVERIRIAAPEMLELNYGYQGPIELVFEAERIDHLEKVS